MAADAILNISLMQQSRKNRLVRQCSLTCPYKRSTVKNRENQNVYSTYGQILDYTNCPSVLCVMSE